MDKLLFKVNSIDYLSSSVAEIRSLRKGFITNFYLDPAKHAIWIIKGDCYTERINDTLFIIKLSPLFWNVYFCSTALVQLIDDFNKLQESHPQQSMVFDIVGREVQCMPIVSALQGCNCKMLASLVRMKRVSDTIPEMSSDPNVLLADDKSIPEIYQSLHVYFNERIEQIPYFEELMDCSHQRGILVCEENGAMAGFLIFEHNPSTLYLRYWFTHPNFRERRVGSRLMHRFFEEGKETRRQLLWVVQTNDNAIKRYRHYGFTEEDMFDYVLQFN